MPVSIPTHHSVDDDVVTKDTWRENPDMAGQAGLT